MTEQQGRGDMDELARLLVQKMTEQSRLRALVDVDQRADEIEQEEWHLATGALFDAHIRSWREGRRLPEVEPGTDILLPVAGAVRAWFDDPQLRALTPAQCSPDGHVSGHLAEWTPSFGFTRTASTPRSRSGYASFLVEQLDLPPVDPDHAPATVTVGVLRDTYGRPFAAVNIGEDPFGIWVAGTLLAPRPVRIVLSGEWHREGAGLELTAIVAGDGVTAPAGFPIAEYTG